MKNIVNSYVRKFKEEKRKSRRAVALLLALALLVATGVTWQLHSTGIALTNETYCGLEEHTHTEECYSSVLVCGMEECEGHTHTDACYETVTTLVCGLEESEGHTHTDDCYDEDGNLICGLEESEGHTHSDTCYQTEQVLTCGLEESEGHTHTEECYEEQLSCGLEEHTHTIECMVDETADVETASDWEATLPALSGVWAEDVVAIAESQIGYTESIVNYTLDDDGETHKGYTRYGAWYGNKYGDWCAMFVSFCLHYAGVPESDFPETSGVNAWTVSLDDMGLYATDCTPSAGDLVFFDNDGDGTADHVGIVTKVDEDTGKITIIEGDYDDAVKQNTYSLSDSDIIGYGLLPEQEVEDEAETDVITLTYEGEDYTVTATCDEDAELPENVELIVTEYEKDSDVYLSRYAEAAKLYGWNEESDYTGYIRLFNIGFYNEDGEEIEPAAEVQITITYLSQEMESESFTITHFGETETETIETETGYEDGTQSISFNLSTFSDVMVVGQETIDYDSLAESGNPEAIQALADSGYFEYWSDQSSDEEDQIIVSSLSVDEETEDEYAASSVQITKAGGSECCDDGVTISNSIAGSDTENVFDITLTVETTTNISELYTEPDMAVVIVMDISNSMTSEYGDTTRYEAAIAAAESFLDEFADATNSVSQVGFAAFNSDAMEVFDLSSCSSETEAEELKNEIRTETGSIITKYSEDSDYYKSNRFTNIEAGLKRAADMLDEASNENKYIIFLSDGFPTTYIESGYDGYDTYTSSGTKGADGVFYGYVRGYYCSYGTSYSDKAAIRAREMATSIKESGVNIFSIGIDVGGQTIDGYERYGVPYSVIDRTTDSYEIGSSSSADAFKSWLKGTDTTGIGSGYYYDSTDEASLLEAYESIFEEIQSMNEESAQAKWVATDPLPTFTDSTDTTVEFLGFYKNDGDLEVYPPTSTLIGEVEEGGENSATYIADSSSISWDLKNSGYTAKTSSGTTTYTYTLTYRVRLQNESDAFEEDTSYATNGNASLIYQTVTTVDGVTTVSEEKTLTFPVPKVEGYLGELTFTKVDQNGDVLEGATFTLSHNTDTCNACRGDGSSSVDLEDMTATSDENGTVTFTNIPSGHTYILTETTVPEGYSASTNTYTVTVSYDEVIVIVIDAEGNETDWTSSEDYTIVNNGDPEVEKRLKTVMATGRMKTQPELAIPCNTNPPSAI
ncbi:MAG: VWA domain-containing protein [Clostridiales bacterium]|nr:VWA domain-containing protein [Clostridiales bacterium]